MYSLGGGADPERGWGRADETWTVKAELAAYGAEPAWFGLGDRDLATHLVRTRMLARRLPALGGDRGAVRPVAARRPDAAGHRRPAGDPRRGRRPKAGRRGDPLPGVVDPATAPSCPRAASSTWGRSRRSPRPGVIEALAGADVVLLAPSNPVVSHRPDPRRPRHPGRAGRRPAPVVGCRPIIGGAPVRGMADACLARSVSSAAPPGWAELYGARSGRWRCSTAGWWTRPTRGAEVPGVRSAPSTVDDRRRRPPRRWWRPPRWRRDGASGRRPGGAAGHRDRRGPPGDDLAALIADGRPLAARRRRAGRDQQDRLQGGGPAGGRCRRPGPSATRPGPSRSRPRPPARSRRRGQTRIVADPPRIRARLRRHRRVQCGAVPAGAAAEGPRRLGPRPARRARRTTRRRVAVDHLRHHGPALAQRPDRRRPRRGRHRRRYATTAGETDPYGNELHLTQMAVVDELAAAGELVKGKRDQVPVAVVRGVTGLLDDDGPGVVPRLVRDVEQDLFTLGTAEARAAGLRASRHPHRRPGTDRPGRPRSGTPGDRRPATQRHHGHLAGAGHPRGCERRCATGHAGAPLPARRSGRPAPLVTLGADTHRLRAALAAEGLTTALRPGDSPATVVLLVGADTR